MSWLRQANHFHSLAPYSLQLIYAGHFYILPVDDEVTRLRNGCLLIYSTTIQCFARGWLSFDFIHP